jgi:hypothetical protein
MSATTTKTGPILVSTRKLPTTGSDQPTAVPCFLDRDWAVCITAATEPPDLSLFI